MAPGHRLGGGSGAVQCPGAVRPLGCPAQLPNYQIFSPVNADSAYNGQFLVFTTGQWGNNWTRDPTTDVGRSVPCSRWRQMNEGFKNIPRSISTLPINLSTINTELSLTFFHTPTLSFILHAPCSSVSLGGSHLVVAKKIGREERSELRRSRVYQILLDCVPLRSRLIFK